MNLIEALRATAEKLRARTIDVHGAGYTDGPMVTRIPDVECGRAAELMDMAAKQLEKIT